jgi:hypothetical protein
LDRVRRNNYLAVETPFGLIIAPQFGGCSHELFCVDALARAIARISL